MTKKILVVDDEPGIVKMVTSRLRANGYDVMGAFSGEEGLEKCRKFQPDAVVLDIMMPDMDGPSVAEAMKDDPTTCTIPVIFLSAAVNASEVPKSHKVGGQYVVAKPFKGDELLEMLKQIMSAP